MRRNTNDNQSEINILLQKIKQGIKLRVEDDRNEMINQLKHNFSEQSQTLEEKLKQRLIE